MMTIPEKKSCAGCSACASICAKGAIKMIRDEDGFCYPQISEELCVDCGACDTVCPISNIPEPPSTQIAYAVKHKDAEILNKSTSGGVFTALSDQVLSLGGVVYGAAFDENMVVTHIRAADKETRDRMRGSKYVESNIGDTFLSVKKDLEDKKAVLFTGTPCQIAGLKKFLRGKDDGLICCDLLCHGVPSSVIFGEHLKFISKLKKKAVIGYDFRPKRWSWHVHREIVRLENNVEYHSSPYSDLWRNIYYSRVATRPSCNNCVYSNLNRRGDISIGDCRGIDKVLTDFESNHGVSLVIINTPAGEKCFDAVKDMVEFRKMDVNDVLQPPLRVSSKPNPCSEKFFDDYRKFGYKKAVFNYFGRLYPVKYPVKMFAKKVVKKILK